MLPPTQRFSTRVENYVKYRPHYPDSLIELLRKECGLPATSEWKIADIGSGTGISSELLLANGNTVYGVEPNLEMRLAGEVYLKSFPKFHSIDGTAEATTLPDKSVDMILAGQAFHWFDQTLSKQEFRRILKPAGKIVLLWNERAVKTTPFLTEYERMLQDYCPEYHLVDHRQIDRDIIAKFFAPHGFSDWVLPNAHIHDYDGISGRLLSSSYAPNTENPLYEPMMNELRRIFGMYNSGGTVTIDYATKVYIGTIE